MQVYQLKSEMHYKWHNRRDDKLIQDAISYHSTIVLPMVGYSHNSYLWIKANPHTGCYRTINNSIVIDFILLISWYINSSIGCDNLKRETKYCKVFKWWEHNVGNCEEVG